MDNCNYEECEVVFSLDLYPKYSACVWLISLQYRIQWAKSFFQQYFNKIEIREKTSFINFQLNLS